MRDVAAVLDEHVIARQALVAHAVGVGPAVDLRADDGRLEQVVAGAAVEAVGPDQRVHAVAAVDVQQPRPDLDVVVATGRLQRAGDRRRVDDVAIGAHVGRARVVLDLQDVAADRQGIRPGAGEDVEQRDLRRRGRALDDDRVAVGVPDERHLRGRDAADVHLQDLLDAQLGGHARRGARRRQAARRACAGIGAADRRRGRREGDAAAAADDADRDRGPAEGGADRDLAAADGQRVGRRDLRARRRRESQRAGEHGAERRRHDPRAPRPAPGQHAVALVRRRRERLRAADRRLALADRELERAADRVRGGDLDVDDRAVGDRPVAEQPAQRHPRARLASRPSACAS